MKWLAANGIAAQHLDIYEVLGGVAYSCSRPGLYLGEKYKSMAKVLCVFGAVLYRSCKHALLEYYPIIIKFFC
jgi:hypothetical protein